MANRKQPSATPKWPNLIACMGDSLTHNYTTQVNLADFWPTRLAVVLTSAGADSRAKNCGTSGNTTGQMLRRVAALTNNGVPALAVLFGGVNDPSSNGTVQESPTPTATSFALAPAVGATPAEVDRFAVGGWINVNDTTQNAGAGARQIESIVGDLITLTAPLSAVPATGAVIRNDTYRNLGEMIDTLDAAGCERIMVVSAQYKNFASGGDTLSVPYAPYVPVRAAQAAIATEKAVPFVDLYTAMRALIVAGTVTQGDDTAWHVATGDQHLNVYGEQIVADTIMAKIEATTGWLTDLSEA